MLSSVALPPWNIYELEFNNACGSLACVKDRIDSVMRLWSNALSLASICSILDRSLFCRMVHSFLYLCLLRGDCCSKRIGDSDWLLLLVSTLRIVSANFSSLLASCFPLWPFVVWPPVLTRNCRSCVCSGTLISAVGEYCSFNSSWRSRTDGDPLFDRGTANKSVLDAESTWPFDGLSSNLLLVGEYVDF